MNDTDANPGEDCPVCGAILESLIADDTLLAVCPVCGARFIA